MEKLRRETGETIHLAVLDECEIVLIERLKSPHATRHVEPLGGRAPVLVTATGKAMLAQMPEADIERVYGEAVRADSQASAVSAALPLSDLLVELRDIASRGYATTASWCAGVFATGAAISGPDWRPIAAIIISTPAARATADARSLHAQLIVAAVSQIAEHLS